MVKIEPSPHSSPEEIAWVEAHNEASSILDEVMVIVREAEEAGSPYFSVPESIARRYQEAWAKEKEAFSKMTSEYRASTMDENRTL